MEGSKFLGIGQYGHKWKLAINGIMDKNNDQKQKILNHLKEPIFRMILTKFEEIWISLLGARALLRFFLKKWSISKNGHKMATIGNLWPKRG